VSMADIAGIVETQVREEVGLVDQQLERFAASVAPVLSKSTPAELRERLKSIQQFDPNFLQLRILDGDGKLVVASNDEMKEPINRVAVGFALDGRSYISESFFSKGYNTEVVAVSAPILAADKSVAGVTTAVLDIRASLNSLIGKVKFNASGAAVVVDG